MKSAGNRQSNLVSRYLAAEREAAAEAESKIRRRSAKLKARLQKQRLKQAAAKVKLAKLRRTKKAAAAKAAKTATDAASAKAADAQEFGANSLGQGKANGGGPQERQKRLELLDRMRHLQPLPAQVEEYWAAFRAWWPAWVGKERGKVVGSELVAKIAEWKAAGGEKNLFAQWVAEQWEHCPPKVKAAAPKAKAKPKQTTKLEGHSVKL